MRSKDRLIWMIARLAGRARRLLHRHLGIQLKGVGFLLRQLRSDFEFEACGYRWLLDHRIAGPYANLLANEFNEPETIALLTYVADHASFEFSFVDVGANVGEMVIPLATHAQTSRVIAFEPHPVCAHVCRQNLILNNADKGEVRQKLVANGEPQPYVIDPHASPLSGIRANADRAQWLPSVTLDEELKEVNEDLVLLIDVEGAELEVLKSGRKVIAERQPLLIFEYHAETAKQFSLDEVRAVIGREYDFFRLCPDGHLDTELTHMFNCVAVSPRSPFAAVVAPLCIR